MFCAEREFRQLTPEKLTAYTDMSLQPLIRITGNALVGIPKDIASRAIKCAVRKTMSDLTDDAAQLIMMRVQLNTWLGSEAKKLSDYFAPYRQRLQEIDNKLLALSISQRWENLKTEHGTAYRQTTLTPKIEDRDKFIDFCLENWESVGNALMQLRAPAVEAFREFMDANQKAFPPGTTGTFDTHINIRKS